MEMVLPMLMGFGIFVIVTILIGFAIVGPYILYDRRVSRAAPAKTVEETIAKVLTEQHAEVHSKTVANEPGQRALAQKLIT